MVKAPKATLSAFLAAVGVTGIEPALLRVAITNNNFDRMRDAEQRLQERAGIEGTNPARRRMRRGQVGGFVSEVSEDDAAYMTDIMERARIPALSRYLKKKNHVTDIPTPARF